MLANDQEDIWFDLYRSITSQKDIAESTVEKQVQKAQRLKRRQLRRKKERIDQLKDLFITSEMRFLKECEAKQIVTLRGRIE